METLTTRRLVLEPLLAGHADELYEVLRDRELYRYLDYGAPPSADHLRAVYQELESRVSSDGGELWLNWVVRADGRAVGFVQATVRGADAWIAYVLGRQFWGRGYASEAVLAMIEQLRSAYGVRRFLAVTEAANVCSIALLTRLSFRSASGDEVEGQDLSPSERLFVSSAASDGRDPSRGGGR